MINERFGRLHVVQFAGSGKWECRCDCGAMRVVMGRSLKNGHTRSCGCLQREAVASTARALMTRHGHAGRGAISPTWKSWNSMMRRCNDPGLKDYARWGGRGIKVCDRWTDFGNFLADMGERPSGTTLDRFPDNDGNYEPGNARWATKKEQGRNCRSNVFATRDGQVKTVAEWAELTGIQAATLYARIRKGKTGDDLFAPAKPWNRIRSSHPGVKVCIATEARQ